MDEGKRELDKILEEYIEKPENIKWEVNLALQKKCIDQAKKIELLKKELDQLREVIHNNMVKQQKSRENRDEILVRIKLDRPVEYSVKVETPRNKPRRRDSPIFPKSAGLPYRTLQRTISHRNIYDSIRKTSMRKQVQKMSRILQKHQHPDINPCKETKNLS